MKTPLRLMAALVLVFGGSSALRADINDLSAIAFYADQLLNQGITGPRFVQMVDQRYWQVYPSDGPGNRGMGAFVQEMHARGLRGRALADAIHEEQNYRAGQIGKPLPPGQAKKVGVQPLPPGQAKKVGVQPLPPGQAKKFSPPGMKPKDKAAFFGGGHGNGHGNGKGHKK